MHNLWSNDKVLRHRNEGKLLGYVRTATITQQTTPQEGPLERQIRLINESNVAMMAQMNKKFAEIDAEDKAYYEKEAAR